MDKLTMAAHEAKQLESILGTLFDYWYVLREIEAIECQRGLFLNMAQLAEQLSQHLQEVTDNGE